MLSDGIRARVLLLVTRPSARALDLGGGYFCCWASILFEIISIGGWSKCCYLSIVGLGMAIFESSTTEKETSKP